MLPSTTTISVSGGSSESTTRLSSSKPVTRMDSGSAGATSGFRKARPATYTA